MKLLNGQLPLHIIKELKLLRSVAINIDLGSSAFQVHFIFVDFVKKLLLTAIYTTYSFSFLEHWTYRVLAPRYMDVPKQEHMVSHVVFYSSGGDWPRNRMCTCY